VLSPTEFGLELTELLLSNAPTLTGQQILEVRQCVLECARKHGWVDV
jgi:CspA family cold shock protein